MLLDHLPWQFRIYLRNQKSEPEVEVVLLTVACFCCPSQTLLSQRSLDCRSALDPPEFPLLLCWRYLHYERQVELAKGINVDDDDCTLLRLCESK